MNSVVVRANYVNDAQIITNYVNDADVANAGVYRGEFTVIYSDGRRETFPAQSQITITIKSRIN
jgi:hypothetical protein